MSSVSFSVQVRNCIMLQLSTPTVISHKIMHESKAKDAYFFRCIVWHSVK